MSLTVFEKACPAGFRSSSSYSLSDNDVSECEPCVDSLSFHDWLYLLFMSLSLLLLEWYIIDFSLKRRNLPFDVITLHISAAIEVATSSLIVILIKSDPLGNFSLKSCRVSRMSDWYTVFYNPAPGYKDTLRCTQEAVYPLYSMVFIFYGFALLLLLVIRPFIARKIADKNASKTIYLTMYLIPGLTLIHAILSGLICKYSVMSLPLVLPRQLLQHLPLNIRSEFLADYLFAYITIVGSIISIAAHLAFRLDQRMSVSCKFCICSADAQLI